jgi:hypothetical protein
MVVLHCKYCITITIPLPLQIVLPQFCATVYACALFIATEGTKHRKKATALLYCLWQYFLIVKTGTSAGNYCAYCPPGAAAWLENRC